MEDILDDIPINEDDIVINLNYLLIYKAFDNTGNFVNDLFQKEIRNYFRSYNFNNTLRIKDVIFDSDSIEFFIKQVSPDIAMQNVVDDIDKYLRNELDRHSIKLSTNDWEIVKIFSIGNIENAKKDMDNYLERLDDDDE